MGDGWMDRRAGMDGMLMSGYLPEASLSLLDRFTVHRTLQDLHYFLRVLPHGAPDLSYLKAHTVQQPHATALRSPFLAAYRRSGLHHIYCTNPGRRLPHLWLYTGDLVSLNTQVIIHTSLETI